ncbi:hypothetical protein QBC41DRAFT_326460 [Cercophora samala]|uniref:DUF7732 domain-containing protein n=1 Tax=Cercophora samala TaxID=330535 RepID=A0AA39Z8L3_9PEZI|nr:hypothetical protein QBC41DRAFT_326460 [Cercophora samala]
MKLSAFLTSALLVTDATVHGLVTPPVGEIAQHEPVRHSGRDTHSHDGSELWKRRGGGGGGGRGGGGGSSGSSSGSSGGSSGTSGSGSTGGGAAGGSGSRGSPSSNSGGRTTTGTGPAPAYGGGRYYGGGAAVPYRAGGRSPTRNVAPLFLGLAFLSFWPGLWLTSAYLYRRPGEGYTFYNVTTDRTETKPVICACAENSVCGCDDNDDEEYMKDLIGNGSYAALDKSVVDVAPVNGTSTILINGTLPDGTTAPGGTEAPGSAPSSAAGDGLRALLEHAGWWPVVATVAAVVFTA